MVWSSDCTDSPAVIINHTKHQPSSSSISTSTSGILSAQSSSSNPCTKVSSFTTYTAAIAGVNSSIKKSDSKNRPFGAEVNCARFFYMDKFIMLVSKRNLTSTSSLSRFGKSYFLSLLLSLSVCLSLSFSLSLIHTHALSPTFSVLSL